MEESTVKDLSDRLARVERSARRWKWCGGMAVALAALVVLAGAHSEDQERVIEAERIILRGNGDTVRAALGVHEDGSVRFDLNDDQGRKRLGLIVMTDGNTAVGMWDEDGQHLIQLGCRPGKKTDLYLSDRKGHNYIELGVDSEHDNSGLSVVSQDHTSPSPLRAGLFAKTDGTTDFDLRSGSDAPRVLIRCRPGADPTLQMWDKAGGQPIVHVP